MYTYPVAVCLKTPSVHVCVGDFYYPGPRAIGMPCLVQRVSQKEFGLPEPTESLPPEDSAEGVIRTHRRTSCQSAGSAPFLDACAEPVQDVLPKDGMPQV